MIEYSSVDKNIHHLIKNNELLISCLKQPDLESGFLLKQINSAIYKLDFKREFVLYDNELVAIIYLPKNEDFILEQLSCFGSQKHVTTSQSRSTKSKQRIIY